MKQIAALLLATVSLLASNGSAVASDRWGWTSIERMKTWPNSQEMPIAQLDQYVVEGQVSVVPVAVDPTALKVPGVLATAVPQLQEAVAAIRTVVASDPALVTNLKARGLGPHDVVGLSTTPDGLTLFVSAGAA